MPTADRSRGCEQGSALVAATMTAALLAAFGSALALIAVTEHRLAWHYGRNAAALYAAEAGLERAVQDLLAASDWDAVLRGDATSGFIDGPAVGTREAAGTRVDLARLTNELRCGRALCAEAEIAAVTADRPWGRNNPRWQLYAWGPLRALAPSAGAADDAYLLVWAGDDPNETDADPLRDGAGPGNPGKGLLVLVAHAYGPGGVRRAIEAVVRRTPDARPAGPLTWRERY